MMANPIQVKALSNYHIWLRYDDGTEGKINLSEYAGKGIFAKWNDKSFFNQVHIDIESNSIAWDDVIQFCPNTFYFQLKGIDFEE